jgi:hypothetical protein
MPSSRKVRAERSQAVADVAERVARLNDLRTDDFQDEVARLVHESRELWRDEADELPSPGVDPLFDALVALEAEADASPEEMRDAIERARHRAEEHATAR